MSSPSITVYGTYWCPDCRRSKQFLGEHQIPYAWVDIEQDADAERLVIEKNEGKRIIPTLIFEDGTVLVEPSNAQLVTRLGLKTSIDRKHFPLIVIGGGPAGLTAAFYTAREGIDTLVIERAAFGGQAAATEKLDNMPGFPDSISGADFSARLRQQAQKFGVELLQAQDVTRIHSHDNYHCVDTPDGEEYSANALLLAAGSRYRRLGAKGENDYIGAGVHFCATCDGPFYKGKHVIVIGGGNSAAEESLHLLNYVDRLTLLVRKDTLRASQVIQDKLFEQANVDVHWNSEVDEFLGAKSKLNAVRVRNNKTGTSKEIAADGAFIFVGLDPNTAFLKGSAIQLNEWGFIVTGHDLVHSTAKQPNVDSTWQPMLLETSVPGIFAAGDVRSGSTKQVASAAGEGATAALLIRDYLRKI